MWYQIINTKASANEQISYSLFKHVKSLEELTAYTYGIIAADCDSSSSIDDIVTDEHEARLLFSALCAQSIRPRDFPTYVMEYVNAI